MPGVEERGQRGASARAVRYGAYPLVALAATTCLESGERQSLAQAVDGIQKAFHVTDGWIGFLPAAMTIVGVLGSFPFGHLADRVRRTWMLAGAVAAWTGCMVLNAAAGSYAFLFASRMGIGAVEANGPAAVSLLSDYYPVRERAKRIGLYQAGALVGAGLGLGLGGVMVDRYGWRAAFWMWVPLGIVTVLLMLRAPEPRRGDQESDFHADMDGSLDGLDGLDAAAAAAAGTLQLPPPSRVGTIDYRTAGWREAFGEVVKIKSMWFGVLAVTISQSLLTGLQFWGVEYFKRTYGFSASKAGGFAALFGVGAAVGVVAGGFISDRLLRRGIVNARVYVVAFSSMVATALFLPAFISTRVAVTLTFMVAGGLFLTIPVAPAEAILADVVVAPLRGRASSMRSVVRSLAGLAPALIGALSSVTNLRVALILFTPLYAAGGLVMLAAARTYPADLAYVLAESRRVDMTLVSGSRHHEADG